MRKNQRRVARQLRPAFPVICVVMILIAGCASAAETHNEPPRHDTAYAAFGAAWLQIYAAQRIGPTDPEQALRHWQKAIAFLEEAHACDPHQPHINNTLAACYVHIDRSDDAARLLLEMLETTDNRETVFDMLHTIPDKGRVIAAFDAALSEPDLQDEQRFLLLVNAGKYAARSSRFENAVDYYTAALSIDGSDSTLLFSAVSACAAANEYDRGIDICLKYLNNATDITTLEAETFMAHLAMFYDAADRYTEGLQFFQATQERAPDSQVICRLYMSFLDKLERSDEAIAYGESFVEKYNDAVDVRVSLAELYARTDSTKAMGALREILKLKPGHWRVRLALAEFLFDANEADETITVLREGLDESTHRIAAKHIRLHMADYLQQSGGYDEAIAELKRILEDQPNDPQTCNHLGYIQAEHGIDLEEAERLIKIALASDAENAAYLDSLAWVYYKMALRDDNVTRLRAAYVLLRKAMETGPMDPVITDHLGDVCFVLGLFTEAADNWERVITTMENEAKTPIDREVMRKKLAHVKKLIEQPEAESSPPTRPLKPPAWEE